jgi:hypothetical protein
MEKSEMRMGGGSWGSVRGVGTAHLKQGPPEHHLRGVTVRQRPCGVQSLSQSAMAWAGVDASWASFGQWAGKEEAGPLRKQKLFFFYFLTKIAQNLHFEQVPNIFKR